MLEIITFHTSIKQLSVLVFLYFLILTSGFAIELSAPIYLVANADNGDILLENGADISIPPASLAKIMTLNLSLMDAESGRLSYSKLYSVPAGGLAESMRPGSSLLGLSSGDESTLLTLQRAAAMVSANDAAWALALLSNNDAADFILRMNQTSADIGMNHTFYTDPDGWSSLSKTTAGDQLILVLSYIRSHPGVLNRLHSLPWMVYQDTDNIRNKVQKRNTNLLLGRIEGVDGLKTGTIPSAGFHFIATARRGDTRFIALVMGIKTSSYNESLNLRADEAGVLLEWAFHNFYSWKPPPVLPVVIPVRHGSLRSVSLQIPREKWDSIEAITLKSSDTRALTVMIDRPEYLTAPLEAGESAGVISWYKGSDLLLEQPLVVSLPVSRHWRLKDIF